MALRLPRADRRYNRRDENESRRLIEDYMNALEARLEKAEADILALDSGGPGDPPDPIGPTAGFSFTTDDLVAHFTDASTEGDAAITERLWTFGDGTTSTTTNNPTPSHTYPDSGDYQVTLQVTDANGLSDTSAPQTVSVVKPPVGGGGLVFLVRGVNSDQPMIDYPWWNAGQLAQLNPSNCVSFIDSFADRGLKVAVRMYRDQDAKDANGVFTMQGWKDSIKRYADAGLTSYLNQRAAEGTIVYSDIIDDIKSGNRWGREILPAEIEEMAAYSRSLYFQIPAWVRARPTQLTGFNYSALQGCGTIYLFGRGGVSQGGMTQQQWRIADCQQYHDDELAALASLNKPLDNAFGVNIVNGGDGSSGISGDISGRWMMGAQELRDYADILVPSTDKLYQMWEWATDGFTDPYLAQSDIQASMNYIRSLVDNQ